MYSVFAKSLLQNAQYLLFYEKIKKKAMKIQKRKHKRPKNKIQKRKHKRPKNKIQKRKKQANNKIIKK